MNIDAIKIGHNPPDDVNVIIEVPIGGEPIKYEMDKAAGTLVVDRFLYTPMRYPGNYGFVPHTLSDDGDPIDVLVANTRPIVPGAVINVRPIGVLKMEDDGGGDEKIIAVPSLASSRKRYEQGDELHRPAGDHPRADRALLRPLQGSRARQVGEAARLGRCRRGARADHRGDRARQGARSRDVSVTPPDIPLLLSVVDAVGHLRLRAERRDPRRPQALRHFRRAVPGFRRGGRGRGGARRAHRRGAAGRDRQVAQLRHRHGRRPGNLPRLSAGPPAQPAGDAARCDRSRACSP